MISREQFEQYITSMVRSRAEESGSPAEVVFMLDVLCINALMLVGAAQKDCTGTEAIRRIIDRLEQLEQMRKSGQYKMQQPSIVVEGDPQTGTGPKLVDHTPKGKSRIIRP